MLIEESRESERDASSSSRELGIARARQRIDVQEGLAQSRSVRPRRTGGAARQERQLPWRAVGRKSCDAEVVRTCSLGGGSATGARGEHGHCAQEKSRIDEAKRRPAPSTSDTQSYAHFPLLDQPAPTTLVGWCWLARRRGRRGQGTAPAASSSQHGSMDAQRRQRWTETALQARSANTFKEQEEMPRRPCTHSTRTRRRTRTRRSCSVLFSRALLVNLGGPYPLGDQGRVRA